MSRGCRTILGVLLITIGAVGFFVSFVVGVLGEHPSKGGRGMDQAIEEPSYKLMMLQFPVYFVLGVLILRKPQCP